MMGDNGQEMTVAQLLAQNPELAKAVQDRMMSLVGTSSGYVEGLPEEVQRRIRALKNLNLEHIGLENQFKAEITELEKKYLKLYTPLYDKRSNIIRGKYEPNDEECDYESEESEEEDDDEENENEEEELTEKVESTSVADEETSEPMNGIPSFWSTAMQNCPEIEVMIEPTDLPLLEKLIDVRMEYMEEPGYIVHFVFEENDYFSNTVLAKSYFFEDAEQSSDLVFSHSTGTPINWKSEDKDLTRTVVVKKHKNKKTGQTRTTKTYQKTPSFFEFFSPPQFPEEENDDDEDEDKADELADAIEKDFIAGEAFKTKLIPHAVLWFTGDACESGDDDGDDYTDCSEEEDDQDDDGSDEEKDPDFDPKKADAPAECKQQ